MLRVLLVIAILAIPILSIGFYSFFLLCVTAPISTLSIEKAGQFGDSFGIATSLFSGLAFSGVLITLMLQRDEQSYSVMKMNALLKSTHKPKG